MQPQEKHPMTRPLSPIAAALCLAVAAITAAQAGPITIPLVNADFNTVYKPEARKFWPPIRAGWTCRRWGIPILP
jgi:hypothetical protein